MNVHDKAHELVKAIQSSSEYVELVRTIQSINDEPEAKQMVDDFRERQAVLQRGMMAGETPRQEEMDRLEQLYEKLNTHTLIRQMFESERRLSMVIDDINRIITDSLEDVYDLNRSGLV